jgi:TPR repeat protein
MCRVVSMKYLSFIFIFFLFGCTTKPDPLEEAFRTIFSEKFIEAQEILRDLDKNDPEVKAYIGLWNILDANPKGDFDTGIHYLKEAGNSGNALAQKTLALLYTSKKHKNLETASYWAKKHMSSFSKDGALPEDLSALANYYALGLGVAQSWEKAFQFFQESGTQYSRYQIALLMANGDGTEKNIEGAKKALEQLVLEGYSEAKILLDKINENKNT